MGLSTPTEIKIPTLFLQNAEGQGWAPSNYFFSAKNVISWVLLLVDSFHSANKVA